MPLVLKYDPVPVSGYIVPLDKPVLEWHEEQAMLPFAFEYCLMACAGLSMIDVWNEKARATTAV